MARVSRATFITVGVTDQAVLGPSENRVALLFWPPNTGRVTLASDGPVVLDAGITITQQNGGLDLFVERHGLCVSGAWRGIASGAGTNIGVIEVLEG